MRHFLFWIILLLVNNVFALTDIQRNIIEEVDKDQLSQQKFLKIIVNMDSQTFNLGGVKRVGNIVKKELSRLHFQTKWAYEPQSMHRAPTLIATHFIKDRPTILLIGHLDTVVVVDKKHRYSVKKNIAKGIGITDDKGGIAIILYALKALQQTKQLQKLSIVVVLTGDEEESGKPSSISRKPLVDIAQKVTFALDFEPSINLDSVTIARRGITMWTLTSRGNASHSATIFRKNVGYGAIFEMSRVLNSLRENYEKDKNISINPGVIFGGHDVTLATNSVAGTASGKENIVAKIAIAKGDFRFLDAEQEAQVRAKLMEIAMHKMTGTSSEFTFELGIPAMAATDNNRKLLDRYSAVSEALGFGKVVALPANARGAGDISHIASIVPYNLAGLGAKGFATHTGAELLNLTSLPVQTKRAAMLILSLGSEPAL